MIKLIIINLVTKPQLGNANLHFQAGVWKRVGI